MAAGWGNVRDRGDRERQRQTHRGGDRKAGGGERGRYRRKRETYGEKQSGGEGQREERDAERRFLTYEEKWKQSDTEKRRSGTERE